MSLTEGPDRRVFPEQLSEGPDRRLIPEQPSLHSNYPATSVQSVSPVSEHADTWM